MAVSVGRLLNSDGRLEDIEWQMEDSVGRMKDSEWQMEDSDGRLGDSDGRMEGVMWQMAVHIGRLYWVGMFFWVINCLLLSLQVFY